MLASKNLCQIDFQHISLIAMFLFHNLLIQGLKKFNETKTDWRSFLNLSLSESLQILEFWDLLNLPIKLRMAYPGLIKYLYRHPDKFQPILNLQKMEEKLH